MQLEKHLLSKSTFIRGKQCHKSLYLYNYKPQEREKPDAETMARFQRGHQFGSIAHRLFPGGVNLAPKSFRQYRQAVLTTQEVIRTSSYDILYEAGFQADRLLVFLDILARKKGSWIAYEVKSSYRISETFLLDAAFQYYVISRSGLSLKDFFIVHAREETDYESMDELTDIHSLFVQESVLDKIIDLQEFINLEVQRQKSVLKAGVMPDIPMGAHCTEPYPCDFRRYCSRSVSGK